MRAGAGKTEGQRWQVKVLDRCRIERAFLPFHVRQLVERVAGLHSTEQQPGTPRWVTPRASTQAPSQGTRPSQAKTKVASSAYGTVVTFGELKAPLAALRGSDVGARKVAVSQFLAAPPAEHYALRRGRRRRRGSNAPLRFSTTKAPGRQAASLPNPSLNPDALRQAGLARSAVHGTFSPTGPSRPAVARRLAQTLDRENYLRRMAIYDPSP